MENRKRRFDESYVYETWITKAIPLADLKTGYALRRTQRSMKESLADANDQAVKNCSELKGYMEALRVLKNAKQATEEHPEGAKAYQELMAHEIEFQVHEMDHEVLQKPWPQNKGPVDPEKALSEYDWGNLLAGLELVRE